MRMLAACFFLPLRAQTPPTQEPLTLEEASHRMLRSSRALRIAEQAEAMARNEQRRTASTWWPTLQAEGAYVALGNEIGVDVTLLEHTFTLPLIREHLSDVSLTVTWPLFTGGRRWWGRRIARQGVRLASLQRQEAEARLQVTLVAAYYALALGRRVSEVRKRAAQALERHYTEACQLEAQGMLTHADGLYARLCRDEARREWESSEREAQVAAQALGVLVDETEAERLLPVTPFFVAEEAASTVWLQETTAHNYALEMLHTQSLMARDRQKMALAAYLPTIALMGRQTVYAYHLPRNLLPHTMVGVGFSWTLFDGLRREAGVREARLSLHTLTLTEEKTRDDLHVAVDKLRGTLQDAEARIRSLRTAVALNEELCRMRREAFREGMATSLEVTDAWVLLAKTHVALLGAGYEYVVALAGLCTLAGRPEQFWTYADAPTETLPKTHLLQP